MQSPTRSRVVNMTLNGDNESENSFKDGDVPELSNCIDKQSASSYLALRTEENPDLPFSTVRGVFQQVLLRTLNLFNKNEEENVKEAGSDDSLYNLPRPEEIPPRLRVKHRKEAYNASSPVESDKGTSSSTSDSDSAPDGSDARDHACPSPEIAPPEVGVSSASKETNRDGASEDWIVISESNDKKPDYDILVISDTVDSSRDLDSSLNSSQESGIPRKAKRVKRRQKTDISLRSVPEDVFPLKAVRHRRKPRVSREDSKHTDFVKLRNRYSIPSAIYTIREEKPVNRVNQASDQTGNPGLGTDEQSDKPANPCSRRKSLYDHPGIFEAFVSAPSPVVSDQESINSESDDDSQKFDRFSKSRSHVRRLSLDLETPGPPIRRRKSSLGPDSAYLARRRNTVDLSGANNATYPGLLTHGAPRSARRRSQEKRHRERHRKPTQEKETFEPDSIDCEEEELSMDEHNALTVRKGPVMGTSGLMGRQQVYLQAYMERYGRRRSQPDEEQEMKMTLSSKTLSRVAKSETLAKYIRRRLENAPPVKDEVDSGESGTSLRRSMTVTTSGHAKPHFSQSFNEGRRGDRSPKMGSKNMRSCTDPGFLSDSSDCSGLSPAASVSSVDSQPSSPSRSRHSFGSNSSLAKFFRKSQIRSRFHIPTLDDLKRKKKIHKADNSHAEMNKRRSLQFEGQLDDVPEPVHKTRSAGGLDGEQRSELCPTNHGYGQLTTMVDDHWVYRRGRSMKVTSARLCSDPPQPCSQCPQEVHKATSYNTIPFSNERDGINRVQSDSRLALSMTESLPPHWLSAEAGPAYFYDSSDTESNHEIEPFRNRNKSAQSLVDPNTDRSSVGSRMSQSYTEYQSDRRSQMSLFTSDPREDISESLVNVTQDIYSCFASEESKRMIQAQTMDKDGASMSARQRRRLLKDAGRTCSHPDSLPRLERSKGRRPTPDTLSPNQPCQSLPNSRPGSQPNSRPGSRSQSPQPLSLVEAIRSAQGSVSPQYPDGTSARRRIYSSDDSTEPRSSSGCALTRARSLPGGQGPARTSLPDYPYIPDADYEGEWTVPIGSRLEVPSQYNDPQTGSVVRSASDVTDGLHDDRRTTRRRTRPYKSDPFTEFGRDGHPISYHSLKDKLLSQSNAQFYDEVGVLPRRSPSCEESTSSGSQVIDILEEEESRSDTEIHHTDTLSKKKKASVCDDCEASFIPSRALSADMDHLCKHCENKRTERRKAILEIVNTELSYGRDLNIIKEELYVPMQNHSLLTAEQVQQIFLNLEELINVNARFSKNLEQAILNSRQTLDHNFNSIHIGKFFLENSLMFLAFENYCIKHTHAIALLERLEKEKELLRIFLEVSQNENQALRRMNLKSFLMIPVQRVFKYPLLLSRLHQATPSHHKDLQTLKEAQNKIEKILEHINLSTKSTTGLAVSRIKTKGSISRRQTEDIEIQKLALSVVGKQHNEAVIAYMGRLQCAVPTELIHWTSKKVKFIPLYAVLISNVHVMTPPGYEYDDVIFPKNGTVTEASLVLLREKNGKYAPFKDNIPLGRCVVTCEKDTDDLAIEVQEMNKDAIFLRGENISETYTWLKTLRYQSKEIGTWRRRRNALANIMISKPSNANPTVSNS